MKFRLKKPDAKERDAETAIGHFQSQTAEITEAPDPVWARGAVALFAAMVGGAILMAATLHTERVVTARGMVVSKTPTIVVQPLETSVVDSIEVQPGQKVKKGQVLARLNPTISDADVAALKRRSTSLSAQIARLEAEVSGKDFAPSNSDEFIELQTAIHRHRMAEFKASLSNFEQQIAEANSQIEQSSQESDLLTKRFALLGEIVAMKAKLEKASAGSRLNSIEAVDNRLSVERALAEADGVTAAAKHRLEALQAERDTFKEKWRADTVNQLVTARQDFSGVTEELAKATYRRNLVALRSVSDAVVLDVAPVSVGSVIEAAKEVFRLVPLDAKLELEVEINGADQGFVAVGDKVEIKFDAYPFGEHGTAKGEITTISQDSFTRSEGPNAGQVFYRARVAIEKTNLRNVPPDFRLIPGMPVTADIVVGDHSILAALTGGLTDAFSDGLREP
ncbi:HlyD family type I secretion periplasmic adaptor subunit [Jiella sp. M17.18]|uniref:HlyD family type I secretion periplasmic adaptor subunit n=1 Tax=Jiella sp. M17.18 TaxID=3234247 RepID=UPI0034DE8CED